jgi:hypothetical protein
MKGYLGIVLLFVVLLEGCVKSNSENYFDSEKFILSPILGVTFDDLKSLGYTKVDSLGLITKSYGDVVVNYHFLNDNLSIFRRNIVVYNVVDSVQASNWVQDPRSRTIASCGNEVIKEQN